MSETPPNPASTVFLRHWRDSDADALAAMNADPEVMRFFAKPLTRRESDELLQRLRARIDERGWGCWAVEVDGECAGFTGLALPSFSAHFTPCVEIGWRLRREYWGRGIAYAAARVALAFAFETLQLPELVSFTAAINSRSRRLMERLGFNRNERDDFLHPSLPADSLLRPHVLYRKKQDAPAPAAGHVACKPAIDIIGRTYLSPLQPQPSEAGKRKPDVIVAPGGKYPRSSPS